MTARYHPKVQTDIRKILGYYIQESGIALAEDFFEEFNRKIQFAIEKPESFHYDPSGLRRVNPDKFPYHFLYQQRSQSIYVLVLRHHRRSPRYGLDRRH